MPDTSYTGIQVPVGTDGYSFEQQLGDLADSARVVIPAASPAGMSQVESAATAAGFPASAASPLFCYRTDVDALYVNKGAGWERMTAKTGSTPYAMAIGSVAYDNVTTSTTSYQVTLPAGRFTAYPIVLAAGATHTYVQASVSGISTSGFTVNLQTTSGTSSVGSVRWIAMQMEP